MNSVKQSGACVRESTESLMRHEGRCRAAIAGVRPEIEGGRKTAITVVPRLILGFAAERADFSNGKAIWEDSQLVLPGAQSGHPFQNVLTGEGLSAHENGRNASLRLADILGRFPVALLEKSDASAQTSRTSIQAP